MPLTLIVVAGCAQPERTPPASPAAPAHDIGMLVFGDHGYHLDYLEAEDYEPPRTREQFIAAERRDWREDKRPPEEFRPPAMTQYRNGSWVAASGLSPVANAMRDWCDKSRCDFATMLGDNIYPKGATLGADGHDDATRFETIFRAPLGRFAELGADFRIYAALGNHDWKTSRAGAMAQVGYLTRTAPFYMDGIVYRVRPAAAQGAVELFVIDTTVLLAGQTVYEDALADDASELRPTRREDPEQWVVPRTRSERDMVAWLERSLAASDARWKIVIGHHPLWSSAGSKYEQARVLRQPDPSCACAAMPMRTSPDTTTRSSCTTTTAARRCRARRWRRCRRSCPERRQSSVRSIRRSCGTSCERYPELATDWAQGLVWGFAHLTLSGDEATLRFVTTPDDGSGTTSVAHTARFKRRSGSVAGR